MSRLTFPKPTVIAPCDIFANGVVTMANILLQDLEKLTMFEATIEPQDFRNLNKTG